MARPGWTEIVWRIPLWGGVILCCGLPLGWMVWQIAAEPAALVEMQLDAYRWRLLGRTVLYNGLVAVFATAMALPAAMVLGRGRGIFAKTLWFVLPLSLLMPSIVHAYGWSQFLHLCGIYPEPKGLADVARCIGSLATWLWALPAAVIGLALRRVDQNVQQQALLDGALWRITWRQLAGPIVASMAMAGVLAMQEFAVYEPTGISIVATEIRMVFDTGAMSSTDNPAIAPMGGGGIEAGRMNQKSRAAAAMATGLPLLAVIGILSIIAIAGVRRSSAAEQVDMGQWPKSLEAGWVSKILAGLFVIVAMVVPIAALVLSLHGPIRPLRIWNEFSPQATGSLSIAAVAGLIAMGIAMAATVTRGRGLLALSILTFLVGGQLLAIAQIRLYNRGWLGWVYNAPPLVVMAYVARFGWIPLLAARMTWWWPWRQLRDLAAVDGADWMRTAYHVIWPLAWPILGAAAMLVMILSLTEVPATVLLSPQRPQMLIPSLMTWVHMLRFDPMIEGSLLLMAIVAALAIIVAGMAYYGKWKMGRLSLLFIFLLAGCDQWSQPDDIWGETGIGPAQVVYPRAISYSKQSDTFFIVDRMARVQQLDRGGKYKSGWRMPDWELGKPVGLTVGPDGNVYVPDTHYQRIMVYTPAGELVRQWGSSGKGPGQFVYPTDVAFDSQGRVFVSEYGDNDRIQVFDQQGNWLYQFGRFGQGDGEFSRPQSMVIDGEMVYITDSCNHRIAVFKTDGTFVRNMGGVGSELGKFRFPYGLDQDSDGNLIVCEFGNNRVQKIDKETGKGLEIWGGGGREPGRLAYPWAVAVDKKDRIVAVDAGNNRLQVFEF